MGTPFIVPVLLVLAVPIQVACGQAKVQQVDWCLVLQPQQKIGALDVSVDVIVTVDVLQCIGLQKDMSSLKYCLLTANITS